MVRKLIFLFISVPIAVVLILLSVANRTPIMMSLDPFRPDSPAFAITLPFFVYVFGALIVGLILGSMATWFTQGKYRKNARAERISAAKWKNECEDHKKRAEDLASEKAAQLLEQSSQNQAA